MSIWIATVEMVPLCPPCAKMTMSDYSGLVKSNRSGLRGLALSSLWNRPQSYINSKPNIQRYIDMKHTKV